MPKPPTGKIAFLIFMNPTDFHHRVTVLALQNIRVHKDWVKKSNQGSVNVRLFFLKNDEVFARDFEFESEA